MLTVAVNPTLVGRIDAALPQTQCTRCGYPRCRAYAEAIARGEADINRCPPGGETTIHALAALAGMPAKPLDPEYGTHQPRRRAIIDESRCIGCRKCIEACPVDAIVGAHKWMHTVIATQCTGCELCLPPCPVDCIDMAPVAVTAREGPWPEYTAGEAGDWRDRTEARLARLALRDGKRKTRDAPARGAKSILQEAPEPDQIRAEIRAAIERVKRRRGGAGSGGLK